MTSAVLALGFALLLSIFFENGMVSDARRTAQEIATHEAGEIQEQLSQDLAATQTLATFVKQGNGHVANFETVARDILPAYKGISALELAPKGIIRQIVPLAGNEKAIGHNLLADPQREKEALHAVGTGKLTLAGPFALRQGGEAMIGRLPVFLKGPQGTNEFWGFTIALIRMDDFLNTIRLGRLEKLGYAFRLSRQHPDTGQTQIITRSSVPLEFTPERVKLEVPNGQWHLDIAPIRGWHTRERIILEGIIVILMAWLAGGFTYRQAASRHALEESERKYRRLVTTTREGLLQVDGAERITYANDTMARLLGHENGDALLGRPLENFVFCEDLANHRQQMKSRRQGERALYERCLQRKDGTPSWCLFSSAPLQDDEGHFIGSIALVTDYNERKAAEQAFKSLNRDFVTLLESTSDFIYFKDHESRFRFCSQTLARITGHGHWRDMIGKHDREVFPPDTAQIYYEEELPIFRDGKPLLDKIDPYYDEQGQPGWVSTNKWPVFGEDGKSVVGIFGISRNVTERVRTEAQLLAANRELQGFTYAASHDLKAPLGRINSFSTLLERNYRDRLEGDGLMLLNFIRSNATRMTALIDDLLAHAQIEQQTPNLQPVALRAAVQAALNEKTEEIGQLGARILLQVPDIQVQANPHGLAQVLRNLMENALKYSRQAQPPIIEIGAREQADSCRFWVRDNGIGFDMAYHDRIFEIFRRLHTYEEFPGSGVGLALVRKAMESMGGRVWAESAIGEGATFFLEFNKESPFQEDKRASTSAA